MIKLELPYPPSVNHYKSIGRMTRTKSGKIFQMRINSDKTKIFYYEVWMIARSLSLAEGELHRDEISIEVTVELYPPDKRRRDIDNSLKVLLDSLVNARIIKDDSQIHLLIVRKMDTIEKGKVIITIRELGT